MSTHHAHTHTHIPTHTYPHHMHPHTYPRARLPTAIATTPLQSQLPAALVAMAAADTPGNWQRAVVNALGLNDRNFVTIGYQHAAHGWTAPMDAVSWLTAPAGPTGLANTARAGNEQQRVHTCFYKVRALCVLWNLSTSICII